MERAVERKNAIRALKRARRNKGSPGIDGMAVKDRRSMWTVSSWV
ncbi:hypothetical protein BH23GEM1_BH23GEM1_00740 [soil metagenome]